MGSGSSDRRQRHRVSRHPLIQIHPPKAVEPAQAPIGQLVLVDQSVNRRVRLPIQGRRDAEVLHGLVDVDPAVAEFRRWLVDHDATA